MRYRRGRISTVQGSGTVYQLLVRNGSGRLFTIPVEHRYYRMMVEGEGELEGKRIRFDTKTKSVKFI